MALSITHAAVVVTADDGTSEVGSNEWNAPHTLTGVASEAQGGTGLSALGTGVATFLGTPSSANLATAVTDETGSGALVFANTPTLVTPALGAATATSVVASSTVSAVKHNVTSTTTASAVSIISSTSQTAAYTVTLPSSQGNASTFLQNNGSGVTSWAVPTASIAPLTLTSTSVVEQKDSTVAQTFRVYNTFTDASNYERGVFDWTTTANVLSIGSQALGTGTVRAITLGVLGTRAVTDGEINIVPPGAGNVWVGKTNLSVYFNASTANRSSAAISDFGLNFISGAAIFWTSNTATVEGGGGDTSIIRKAAKVVAFADSTLAGATGWVQWAGQTRVSADVTSTSTAMAAVTGLAANLQASRTYSFSAYLPFTDAAAGGIQADVNYDAAQTNVIYDGHLIDYGGTPAIRGPARASAFGTAVASSVTTGTSGLVGIKGTVTTTSTGTLTIRFAQNTANATATTIKRGAYMIIHDMP